MKGKKQRFTQLNLNEIINLNERFIAWDVADATVYMSPKTKQAKKKNNPLGRGPCLMSGALCCLPRYILVAPRRHRYWVVYLSNLWMLILWAHLRMDSGKKMANSQASTWGECARLWTVPFRPLPSGDNCLYLLLKSYFKLNSCFFKKFSVIHRENWALYNIDLNNSSNLGEKMLTC